MNENEQAAKESSLGSPELPPLNGEWESVEPSEKPAQQTAGMAESFSMLATVFFGFVASRKGDHWNLSKPESESFGEAADKVAAMYMDGSELSPWVGLLMVAGMIAVPRMMIDSKIEEAQKARKENESKPD